MGSIVGNTSSFVIPNYWWQRLYQSQFSPRLEPQFLHLAIHATNHLKSIMYTLEPLLLWYTLTLLGDFSFAVGVAVVNRRDG